VDSEAGSGGDYDGDYDDDGDGDSDGEDDGDSGAVNASEDNQDLAGEEAEGLAGGYIALIVIMLLLVLAVLAFLVKNAKGKKRPSAYTSATAPMMSSATSNLASSDELGDVEAAHEAKDADPSLSFVSPEDVVPSIVESTTDKSPSAASAAAEDEGTIDL